MQLVFNEKRGNWKDVTDNKEEGVSDCESDANMTEEMVLEKLNQL